MTTQEQIDKGTCRVCGCTHEDPCWHPEAGYCSWADETETICSHCMAEELADDPQTIHCINSLLSTY